MRDVMPPPMPRRERQEKEGPPRRQDDDRGRDGRQRRRDIDSAPTVGADARRALYVTLGVIGIALALMSVIGLAIWVEARRQSTGDVGENGTGSGTSSTVPLDWSKVGSTAQIGDVKVEALWMHAPKYFGIDHLGEHKNYTNVAMLKLRFTNTSPTRIAQFKGWYGTGTFSDEHGNNYRGTTFGGHRFIEIPNRERPSDDKENEGCDTKSITAGAEGLHPEKRYVRFLFFEKPTDKAKEIRITLKAESLGGDGVVRFRLPIDRDRP